jgi:hypothetical protein
MYNMFFSSFILKTKFEWRPIWRSTEIICDSESNFFLSLKNVYTDFSYVFIGFQLHGEDEEDEEDCNVHSSDRRARQ